MKKLLVVAAMDVERDLLLSWMENKTETLLANGSPLVSGLIDGHPVDVLLCGIGKVNAAIGCALALQHSHADLVVNSGVAGGLKSHQNPCDMVISHQAIYHDVNVSAFGYAPGQLPGGPVMYEGNGQAALVLAEASIKNNNQTTTGLVVSGDQFVNSKEQVETIKELFPSAVCVEMEAAAIAQTATAFKKEFVIIRALSDKADSDAKHDYGAFVKIAAEKSANLVRFLINHYA